MNSNKNIKLLLIIVIILVSCTRKDIQFGAVPDDTYTSIVFIDTVGVQLSTVITDSFGTSGTTSFLLGNYKDPFLGWVSTRPYFQLQKPASIPEIPLSAVFDSLTFIIHPNDYYYGDTTLSQTYIVNELAQTIVPTYNTRLFNTSEVPVKPIALGSVKRLLNPVSHDSLSIRLSDAKGVELFEKLRQKSAELLTDQEFLNYFKGISLSVGADDTTAVYGFQGDNAKMQMRVHYHTTFPYPESMTIDFNSSANELAFNRVIAGRSGTGLVSAGTNTTEVPVSATHGYAFLQTGTGLSLKMIFPSLHGILSDKKNLKLLKAELIITPTYLSFDRNKFKLPEPVSLVQVDQTNIIGNPVLDSTGSSTQYAYPVIDVIYGESNYYRFNVTAYINALLVNSGTEASGFLLQYETSNMNLTRLVVNDLLKDSRACKLLLTVLAINN